MLSRMGYRPVRQFILLLIPCTLFIILLLGGTYWAIPDPTCADNKRNQEEEEVDCGGPCIPCVLRHIQNIELLRVRFDEVLPGVYDVVAKVKNPNTKLIARTFPFDIHLKDDAGVIIQKHPGRSFLYAGETAYIVEAGIPAKRKITSAEFLIDNKEVQWVVGDAMNPLILIGDKSVETVRQGDTVETRLHVTIYNQALVDFRGIEVGILALNKKNDDIIALNKTRVDELKAGDSASLTFSWPGSVPIDPAHLLVQPRVTFVTQ